MGIEIHRHTDGGMTQSALSPSPNVSFVTVRHHFWLCLLRREALSMGEYFKPYRRKFGILTLMIACKFMAGWVRSLFIHD